GIAGVDGNGQQELAEVILGLRKVRRGEVWIDQRDVTSWGMVERTGLGEAGVPNGRKLEGGGGSMSAAGKGARKRPASGVLRAGGRGGGLEEGGEAYERDHCRPGPRAGCPC